MSFLGFSLFVQTKEFRMEVKETGWHLGITKGQMERLFPVGMSG